MAGSCRIQVCVENSPSFWMLVDAERFFKIADVQRHIERKFKDVVVLQMLLAGTELPVEESSLLLRDNDTVHVIVKQRQDVKQQKNNHSNDSHHSLMNETLLSADQGSQNSQETDSNVKKKKKHKRKTDSEIVEVNINKEDVSDCFYHGNCEEAEAQEISVLPLKKNKKKKHKKTFDSDDEPKAKISKVSTAFQQPLLKQLRSKKNAKTNANPVVSLCLSETVAHDADGEPGSKEVVEPMDQSPVNGPSSNTDSTKNVKKRKRNRKKNKSHTNNSTSIKPEAHLTTTAWSTEKLKLPKAKQPNGKKTVFNSDEEEADTAKTYEQKEKIVAQADTKGVVQPLGVSDTGSSFSESYPSESTPNASAKNCNLGSGLGISTYFDKLLQSQVEVVESEASHTLNTLEDITDPNGEKVYAEKQMGTNNFCHKFQKYHGNHSAEKRDQKSVSALRQSLLPVNLDRGGQHDEPNLVEYLKLAPHERGAKLPPYMTATRLPNGAFLYKRTASLASRNSLLEKDVNTSFPNQTQKTTDHLKVCETDKTVPDGVTLKVVARDYSAMPDMTALPNIGDKIAYKILEMGEDYTPGISDYKEAVVLSHDKHSDTITLRLLHMNDKKKHGRFDLPDEDTGTDQMVTLLLSSLFEPKLLESSSQQL